MNGRSRGRTVRHGIAIVLLASTATVVALLLAAGSLLGARGDEWSVPLRIGTGSVALRLDAGVAALARWATRPLGLRLLDGRSIATRAGVLHLARLDDEHFAIDCSPCRLRFPAFGDESLRVATLRFVGALRDDRLHGAVSIGDVHGRVAGRFDARGLAVDVELEPAPVRTYLETLVPDLPELAVAVIDGRAAFAIHVELPSATVDIRPTVEGLAVSGLGTDALAGRAPIVSCGPAAEVGRWLPLAVVAAEDQRFDRHPGYDLDELAESMSRNERAARVERGGSTIGQQLAKLLYVGDDRSLTRKVREVLYAVEMEQTLGKARILKLYLAIVPWGRGTCGADAAARRYFGKAAAKLAPAEAVWLAAMLHAPDREAARWSASRRIDLVRASRIANGLNARSATRTRIVAQLAALAPPGREP